MIQTHAQCTVLLQLTFDWVNLVTILLLASLRLCNSFFKALRRSSTPITHFDIKWAIFLVTRSSLSNSDRLFASAKLENSINLGSPLILSLERFRQVVVVRLLWLLCGRIFRVLKSSFYMYNNSTVIRRGILCLCSIVTQKLSSLLTTLSQVIAIFLLVFNSCEPPASQACPPYSLR